MGSPTTSDTTCAAFRRLPPELLQPDRVHRFVVGEDPAPRALTGEEAAAELGDPFATLLLLRGVFPRTAGEVLAALDRATIEGDPLRRGFFFLLGEGSQIPMTPATAAVDRNLRFLAARGIGPDGADVLISAFHPDEGNVELMSWDRRRAGSTTTRPSAPARPGCSPATPDTRWPTRPRARGRSRATCRATSS